MRRFPERDVNSLRTFERPLAIATDQSSLAQRLAFWGLVANYTAPVDVPSFAATSCIAFFSTRFGVTTGWHQD